MRYFKYILATAGLVAMLLPGTASAVGTPANTPIANTATATYGVGTLTGLSANSNTVTVTVQQVTDVVVAPINSPITVNPGDTGVAAMFTVTNTGNGADNFSLTPLSAGLGPDNFDPVLSAQPVGVDLYSDGFNPGVGGDSYANVVALGADAYATILVFNDIPAGVADTYTGLTQVTATSNTASGAAGTVSATPGVGGVNAIVGGNGGTGFSQATYTVSSVTVAIGKSSAVTLDPYGSAPPQAIPGATVQYTLAVDVYGNGTATNLVITDAIPANTTYKAGTITLNAAPLTDAVDADAGSFGANTVTVNLSNVAGGSPTNTITFDVTIN